MRLPLRNYLSRSTVGLDIDRRFLAAVQADGGQISQADSMEMPDGLVRDGEVADADGLVAALKEFAGLSGIPKNVRLGIANQQIVVRLVELPVIENEVERDAAIRFQAAEAIAMPLEEAMLDYQIAGYEETPEGLTRMRVVLVAARRAMIEAYVEAVKNAGMKPTGIDLDAFALVRVLARNAPHADSARVFCHLAGMSNLAIAVGDSCLFTRPLSTAWDDPDAAARLADEIRLSMDYYMAQAKALPAGDAMLSGPGSRDERLVADLGAQLSLPTHVADPLGGLDGIKAVGDDDPRRYTVAAGLSLGEAA